MKLGDAEASGLIKKAQLRCGNCAYRQSVEVIDKMHLVGCLTAPNAEGRMYGFVNFVQARACPGSRRKSFAELSAHNTPPPDS